MIVQIKFEDGSIRPIDTMWIETDVNNNFLCNVNFDGNHPNLIPCIVLDPHDPLTIDYDSQYLIRTHANETKVISGYWIITLPGGNVAYDANFNVMHRKFELCTVLDVIAKISDYAPVLDIVAEISGYAPFVIEQSNE
jgi:hypothetical protein